MTPEEAARIVDNAPWAVGTSRECNALNVLIAHAHATAEPEIVDQETANALPDASIVKPADSTILPWVKIDGKWARAYTSGTVTELPDHGPWLVLYRAPEPALPIAVGDTITTAAELDRLPVETVIRDADRCVFERDAPDHWRGVASGTPVLPARVLDLGEVTS